MTLASFLKTLYRTNSLLSLHTDSICLPSIVLNAQSSPDFRSVKQMTTSDDPERVAMGILSLFGSTYKCSICLDHYSDPMMFPCTHSVCSGCAELWLEKKKECPVCKESVREEA